MRNTNEMIYLPPSARSKNTTGFNGVSAMLGIPEVRFQAQGLIGASSRLIGTFH